MLGGTHGIAVAPESGWGYTDDGKAGTVSVFDLKNFKIAKQLPAAPDADGIISDPVSGYLFVINGDSGSITVVDPKTNAVGTAIVVGAVSKRPRRTATETCSSMARTPTTSQ